MMLPTRVMIWVLAVTLAVTSRTAQAQQSPFLKEILLGRCYDHFPFAGSTTTIDDGSSSAGPVPISSSLSSCDDVVGSFMNVLEGRLDSDISTSDFDQAYVGMANFVSPKDAAMIRLPFGVGGGSDQKTYNLHSGPPLVLPPNLVTPEDTLGGRLLKDLVFCGAGVHCSVDSSNAYRQFWLAAYGRFISQVQGRIHIIVDGPQSSVVGILRDAKTLADQRVAEANQITQVQMWATNCSESATAMTMAYLANDLKVVPESNISCDEDFHELTFCHGDMNDELCLLYKRGRDVENTNTNCTTAADDRSDDSAKESHHHENLLAVRVLFWLAVTGGVYWCCCHTGGQRRSRPSRGDRKSLVGNNDEDGDDDGEGGRNRHPVTTYGPQNDRQDGAESYFLGGGAQTNAEDDNVRRISQ